MVCEHCGNERPRRNIPFTGKVIYLRCTCQGALDELAREQANAEKVVKTQAVRKCKQEWSSLYSDEIQWAYAGLDWHDYRETEHNTLAKTAAFALWRNLDRSEGDRKGRRLLWLQGHAGAGKTMLAQIACNAILKSGIPVAQLRATGIVARHAHGSGDEAIQAAYRARVLFIDDLGKESPTEAFQRTLYDMVDRTFQRQNKIMIVTSEFLPSTLFERYSSVTDALRWRCLVMMSEDPNNPQPRAFTLQKWDMRKGNNQ
jgi:DNA replication protein DnaC